MDKPRPSCYSAVQMDSNLPDSDPTRIDLVALDVDVRMHQVMLGALTEADMSEPLVAAFLRLAYVAGYQDALLEPVRGELFRAHGYRVPSHAQRGST
jgi:hypothetical protein